MIMTYKIKDLRLAEEGKRKIEWAESRMPVMKVLQELYKDEKPLNGYRISGCLHVTKETAVLVKTLKIAGAEMAWCGCNPLSTQDDVAAALVKDYDIPVFAWRGLSSEEYYECINDVLKINPNITLDDGADLVVKIHAERPDLIKNVIGGTEETTTGVHRLRAMAESGDLKYPVIAVNDAETKWDFDNIYGTGQSTLDGILRATNILFAGKNVVVSGYGHCGKGVADKSRGLGANVIVTEVNPVNALKAVMDGYRVMPMSEAASLGDVFITATGCSNVIRKEHLVKMKKGAVLANTGHFNVEISIPDLESITKHKKELRLNNVMHVLENGNKIYLLAEGRLVNLAAGEGHPSEVMDMSFANQFLSVLRLVKEGRSFRPVVYDVPREQDEMIARIKLESIGIIIDELSMEQEKYLKDYSSGT